MSSVVDGKEISFKIDRYNNTALLSDKESLVQIIMNALLMVPGNLPSQPLKGVNIFKYLYTQIDSDIMSSEVLSQLQYTVGSDIASTISNLSVVLSDLNGQGPTFLLIIQLRVNNEDNTLALAVQKVDEAVKFNYKFLTDAVKALQ